MGIVFVTLWPSDFRLTALVLNYSTDDSKQLTFTFSG